MLNWTPQPWLKLTFASQLDEVTFLERWGKARGVRIGSSLVRAEQMKDGSGDATHPDMKRFGGPEAGMLQLGVVCSDARFAEFKLTPVMRK